MKGYDDAYRIKAGKYRIGIVLNNKIIEFRTFDHRKDIYKKFP